MNRKDSVTGVLYMMMDGNIVIKSFCPQCHYTVEDHPDIDNNPIEVYLFRAYSETNCIRCDLTYVWYIHKGSHIVALLTILNRRLNYKSSKNTRIHI